MWVTSGPGTVRHPIASGKANRAVRWASVFPQIFGKYVLEREIASGGMAVVYLATLRGAGGFEKRLVVKQIRAELASDAAFVERFVTEAKTTVGLSHPNIVPVYELGVEQGVYFIAMELAQGVTLSELLKTGGRLSPEEGAYLGVEMSRALDYAHRKAGIVHRDVTPRNVLIDEEGAVRLIDFGIAAPVSGDGKARERVYGSPGHMPLEQLRGGRLTPATDVFAVGALLIEAWTNEPPFRRATKAESDAALSVPPPALSRREPRLASLDELLARAVAPDAGVRPQTTEELARPLREFLRTADLGDIARRLGDRVRRARRASQESVRPPPVRSDVVGVTPSTARLASPSASGTSRTSESSMTPMTPATRPLTQPVTETFAAREEVGEWTRPRSQLPPDFESELPAPREEPPDLARVLPPSRRGRRTALIALSVALAGLVGAAVASRTSPSVTPADEGTQASLRTPTALLHEVPSTTPGPVASPPELAVRGATFLPVSAATPTTLPPSAPGAGAGSGTSLPSVASAVTAGVVSPAASVSGGADDAKSDGATVSFTSDLPAKVTIDGAFQGSTPLRAVRKPPGQHVVTIVSLTLDERLTTTVELRRGQAMTVHAEFTRAVPALRVR
ncbi:MAG TPA: protein kinase [Polyangiaceae bacterium]